jgi:hypothetical protein
MAAGSESIERTNGTGRDALHRAGPGRKRSRDPYRPARIGRVRVAGRMPPTPPAGAQAGLFHRHVACLAQAGACAIMIAVPTKACLERAIIVSATASLVHPQRTP